MAAALAGTGVRLDFHRVALQPGKPVAFGTHARGAVLALPGNPVSAFTTFRLFGALVLGLLEGDGAARPCFGRATARFEWRRTHAKWVVLPGRRVEAGSGVDRVPYRGSGDLLAYARADCQIVLPRDTAAVAPGDPVSIWTFEDVS